jgi:D-alanine-D-alanine ligase
MEKLRLALLSGGISSEREVSLNSGNQVYDALDKDKYEIVRYDPKFDLARLVADADGIDAALIILHGPFGEDGTVQGLFELLDIPYQGSGVLGSAVAMNKLVAKQLYEKAGLPVPAYQVFKKGQAIDADACVQDIGLPLVVKPVELGSSVGMTIVRSADQLPQAFEKAFERDDAVMAEAFVDGVELTAGVLGNDELEAFPLIEIIPNDTYEFFDYEAKYTPGATSEICPARIDDADRDKAQEYAMAAHRALACKGYSRTDMILKDGEVYLLETNTIPGMTATSLLPQAAEKAGYSFGALLDRLIELGIEDHNARKGRG